jgi:hypothetical protein
VKDEQLLPAIQRAVGNAAPLRYVEPKEHANPTDPVRTIRSGRQAWFKVHSRALVEFLADRFGILQGKSVIDPPFPKNIPDEWLGHFARGNLDGDGTVCESVHRDKYVTRIVQFLGSHRFMTTLRERIIACVGVGERQAVPSRHSSKITYLQWTAQEDVLKLLHWMYPEGAYLALERKRDTALRFIRELEAPKALVLPEIVTNAAGYAKAYFERDVLALGRAGTPDCRVRYERLRAAILEGKRGAELKAVVAPTRVKDRVARVADAFAGGASYLDLQRAFGISDAQVCRDVRKARERGLLPNHPPRAGAPAGTRV